MERIVEVEKIVYVPQVVERVVEVDRPIHVSHVHPALLDFTTSLTFP